MSYGVRYFNLRCWGRLCSGDYPVFVVVACERPLSRAAFETSASAASPNTLVVADRAYYWWALAMQ